jgi:hypothetical protein
VQRLHAQIPKAQKDPDDVNVFFVLLGSACVKAAHKMLMKLTPGNWLVQELVNAVDDVCPDQGEPAEAATVDHSNCQWRTINFLF